MEMPVPCALAPKLLDRVRTTVRTRHYSPRTEEAYVGWIRRYILFHRKRHPADMRAPEIAAFLSWLAVDRHVSASTQNQALSAILFLYRDVLEIDPGKVAGIAEAKSARRLPVVMSRQEVARVLHYLTDPYWLMAGLLYGAGLRLRERLELRVKDIDFARAQITVRRGKGAKDRTTMLPRLVRERLEQHLERVTIHPRRRFGGGLRAPDASGCARPEVSKRRSGMGLAVRVSGLSGVPRSEVGCAVTLSSSRVRDAARGDGRSQGRGRDQACQLPHVQA